MDIKVFRTFLEVARERHFGRAAENLYITQAAVSARIKQLEAFYDTRLFQRDRHAIRLTSAGERLTGYAETVVRSIEQSKTELRLMETQAIQLTLAGTPNTWDAFLQNCLCVVTSEFEGYAFCADTLSLEQINRALVERTLDMGLSFDPLKSDEICDVEVARLELVLVSAERKALAEALQRAYVYVDWGTRFNSEHAQRHAKMPPPYLRTSTSRIALEFILEKGGAAYLPLSMVEPFLESGQLHQVDGAEPWLRPVFLSYRKDSAAIEQIQAVTRLINSIDPSSTFSLQQAGDSG